MCYIWSSDSIVVLHLFVLVGRRHHIPHLLYGVRQNSRARCMVTLRSLIQATNQLQPLFISSTTNSRKNYHPLRETPQNENLGLKVGRAIGTSFENYPYPHHFRKILLNKFYNPYDVQGTLQEHMRYWYIPFHFDIFTVSKWWTINKV